LMTRSIAALVEPMSSNILRPSFAGGVSILALVPNVGNGPYPRTLTDAKKMSSSFLRRRTPVSWHFYSVGLATNTEEYRGYI
jgi:hypothetical protein